MSAGRFDRVGADPAKCLYNRQVGTLSRRLLMANSNPARSSALPADVPERYQRLLATLVRAYIERGEPVSSLWLARESGLDVSSATVRNVLARLEELGLVRQPHTSAGRVPTDQGYRFYVNLLLHSRRPSRAVSELEGRLRPPAAWASCSRTCPRSCRAPPTIWGSIAPGGQDATLKHMDLVALDSRRVLVVVVSGAGHVTHKVVEVLDAVQPSELTQAANYLNAEFAGMPIAEVRERILERLQEERALYDRLLARALRLASETLGELTSGTQFFVHGAPSLLEAAASEDVKVPLATLRALLMMMEEKHRLVQILSEYLEGPGLTVVIGTEHTEPGLQNLSLVASTYTDSGRQGLIGVIGPDPHAVFPVHRRRGQRLARRHARVDRRRTRWRSFMNDTDLDSAAEAANVDAPEAGASELEALRRERDEAQDRLFRLQAEFDNYRKRVERERRDLGEHFASELLSDSCRSSTTSSVRWQRRRRRPSRRWRAIARAWNSFRSSSSSC